MDAEVRASPDATVRMPSIRSSGGAFLQEAVGSGVEGVVDHLDAPSIAKTLGDAASTLDRGTIGPIATSNTSTVVLRFLDRTLTTNPRLPTGTELIKGLPSMTA